MQESAIGIDSDRYLDILGQSPLLNIYTQICFCFALPTDTPHSVIFDKLRDGLERLCVSFPWLAGQIHHEDANDGNSGVFKIKASSKIPLLIAQDLSNHPSAPTMDALRQADFPISMLDENIIAPRKTLSDHSAELASYPVSVFGLQANFIKGGLLLTFVGQHQVMDATGQGHIIHLLSKVCHHERLTEEELSSGNLDRRNIIPILDESYQPGPELAHQVIRPTSPDSAIHDTNEQHSPAASVKCTWSCFTFSSTSLISLKSLATNSLPSSSGYISTDDALTAFIWQSITRARLPRLDSTDEIEFARAVDVRRYLNTPSTYPGLVQNMTYHTFTSQRLVMEPLGLVAAELRSAVDPETSDLAYNTRALATFLSRSPDKTVASFTATVDLSKDLMLSSLAKLNCYELDFDLGFGKPEAVRRPLFDTVESLVYLLPKSLDGEIAVAVCLRDEDLERLRADEELAKYGKFVG